METENAQNEAVEQSGAVQNLPPDFTQRLEALERELTEQKLRQQFEQAATVAGIRAERIGDAFEFARHNLPAQADDSAMRAVAESIAARFPEFSTRHIAVEVDLGAPGTIASANAKNALDMLRNLRK